MALPQLTQHESFHSIPRADATVSVSASSLPQFIMRRDSTFLGMTRFDSMQLPAVNVVPTRLDSLVTFAPALGENPLAAPAPLNQAQRGALPGFGESMKHSVISMSDSLVDSRSMDFNQAMTRRKTSNQRLLGGTSEVITTEHSRRLLRGPMLERISNCLIPLEDPNHDIPETLAEIMEQRKQGKTTLDDVASATMTAGLKTCATMVTGSTSPGTNARRAVDWTEFEARPKMLPPVRVTQKKAATASERLSPKANGGCGLLAAHLSVGTHPTGFDPSALEKIAQRLTPSRGYVRFDESRVARRIFEERATLPLSRAEQKRQERSPEGLPTNVEVATSGSSPFTASIPRKRRITATSNTSSDEQLQKEKGNDEVLWLFERRQIQEEARTTVRQGASCQRPLPNTAFSITEYPYKGGRRLTCTPEEVGGSVPLWSFMKMNDESQDTTLAATLVFADGAPRVCSEQLQALKDELHELENQTELQPVQSFRKRPGSHQTPRSRVNILDPTSPLLGVSAAARRRASSKWQGVQDWRNPDSVVLESDTNMPPQDIHLYLMYCANKQMTIIIRPVSSTVPDLYAGNFYLDAKYCDAFGVPIPQPNLTKEELAKVTTKECRVRGKSINVSLKSSSYRPIDGLIPVNPALGKAYLDAQKREREIEDMILNAQGGVLTIALLRKLKAQKAQAGSLTQAFVRDIQTALKVSDDTCAALMAKYKQELVLTIDKAAVSRSYLDQFNEAQFLGTTGAKWRGLAVYYTELPSGAVLRNQHDVPVFHVKKADQFYEYDPEQHDIRSTASRDTQNLKPVLVVTHRMFFTSSTTQRIEEEPDPYLIAPDFDGLAYGVQIPDDYPTASHIEWAMNCSTPKLIKSMGLVTCYDEEHLREIRAMTEWKQSHGYECDNTVKTQSLGKGMYPIFTPRGLAILHDFTEIISFTRNAWLEGTPLKLNPFWKVCMDNYKLPRPYGEDLGQPIIDDCGWSISLTNIEAEGVTLDAVLRRVTTMEERVSGLEEARNKKHKHHTKGEMSESQNINDDLVEEMCNVKDKKRLAALFADVRRWQLMPTLFRWKDATTATRPSTTGSDAPTSVSSILVRSPFEAANFASRTPDEAFELFRAERVKEKMEAFESCAALFTKLHPKTAFLQVLRDYLSPEAFVDEFDLSFTGAASQSQPGQSPRSTALQSPKLSPRGTVTKL